MIGFGFWKKKLFKKATKSVNHWNMTRLISYCDYPFMRLIQGLPLELEILILQFSHDLKFGKRSISWNVHL